MKRKLLSVLMALCLILTLLPTAVFAEELTPPEESGEQPSELEILTKTVTKQQAQIESINQSVDDITLAILGGE